MGYIDFDIYGAGGGKSGGSSSAGKEDPNTARSKAIARLLFVIGEGPIPGLVDGYKSLYVNKVAIENPDGSRNYEGVTYGLLNGTPDQEPLPGFEAVSSTERVGLRVRADTPVIYRTNSSDLDAITVTLSIPQLTRLDKEKGELKGHNVRVAIDVRSLSNPENSWVTKVSNDYISQKHTSTWEKDYRIDVEGQGPWLVRMRRLSPDNDNDSAIADLTYFARCTEILDHKMGYAHTAMLGVEVDTEQFGGSVDVEADIFGQEIEYPSNYNPTTRTYDGFWDGTFTTGYCNNASWVWRYVAVHERFGIGIDPLAIDKWGLYQLAQYCDAWNTRPNGTTNDYHPVTGKHGVPDGMGGFEPRFEFDGSLTTQEEAFKVLQQIASMMRAIVFYGAGAVMIRQDAPSTPETHIFNSANVIGSFNYSGTAKRARHNAATVKFVNPEIGGDTDYAVYEDPIAIERYGYNNLNLEGFATRKRSQAYRQAKWAVLTAQLQTELVTFDTGTNAADMLPGDIFEVADPHWAVADFGGRILNPKSDNVIGAMAISNWTPTNLAVGAERKPGPWGSRNLAKLVTTAQDHQYASNNAPVNVGQKYTYSTFVSRTDWPYIKIGSDGVGWASFDVRTGKVTAASELVTAFVELWSEDLIRLCITFQATATNAASGMYIAFDSEVSNVRPNQIGTQGARTVPVGAELYAGAPQVVLGDEAGLPSVRLNDNQIQLDRDIDNTGTDPRIHLTMLEGPLDDIEGANNAERPIRREVRYFSDNVIGYDPQTQIVTLAGDIPGYGQDGVTPLVWIFSKDELKPRPFRAVSVKENTGKPSYQISGIEYSNEKFVRLDEGFNVTQGTENYSNLPDTTKCLPPAHPKAEFVTQNKGGRIVTNVELRFDVSPDIFLRGYLVQYKRDDDQIVYMPMSYSNSVTIEDVPPGNYLFTIRALNKFGISSPAITTGLSLAEQNVIGQKPVVGIYTDRGNQSFTGEDIHLFLSSTALSQSAQTSAIYTEIRKSAMIVENTPHGEQQVTPSVGETPSTLAATVYTGAPQATAKNPVITVTGAPIRHDELIVTIGLSQFVAKAGANPTPASVAATLAATINADPRYSAVAAGANVTLSFADNVTGAADVQSHQDPLFDGYRIVVFDPITNVALREEFVRTPEYIYTLEQNRQDFGTPSRSVKFEVQVRDVHGNLSTPTAMTMTNPAPFPPSVTFQPTPDRLNMLFSPPADADYGGVELYLSPTANFTPTTANLVYRDRGNPSIPVMARQTLYAKFRFFDSFGMTGVAFSSEVEIIIPAFDARDVNKDGYALDDIIDGVQSNIDNLFDTYGDTENAAASAAAALAAQSASEGFAQTAQAAQIITEQAKLDAQDARDASQALRDQVAGIKQQSDALFVDMNAVKAQADALFVDMNTIAGQAAGSATSASQSKDTAVAKAGEAGDYAQAASADRVLAQTARGAAEAAEVRIATVEDTVEGYRADALSYRNVAAGYRDDALAFRDSAGFHAGAAITSAQQASTSETLAGQHANAADADRVAAQTARSEAQSARDTAVGAKNDADGSAATATSQAALSVTARLGAQRALQASNPDNFTDPSTWATDAGWGATGYIDNGSYITINGSAFYALHSIPVVPNETYRLSARFRTLNQGGGEAYIGVLCRPSSNLIWVVGGIQHVPLEQWQDFAVDFLGAAATNAFPGTTHISAFLLLGHPNVSDAQTTKLSLTNVNATVQAQSAASASNASASTATAQADLAGQRASAADASMLAAQTARGGSEAARDTAVSAKNDAQGFAGAAASSATLAVSAKDAAQAVASSFFPDFSSREQSWHRGIESGNLGVWEPNHPYGAGLSLADTGSYVYVQPLGRIPKAVGRTYRATYWFRQWRAGTLLARPRLYWADVDSNGNNGRYLGLGTNAPGAINYDLIAADRLNEYIKIGSEYTVTDDNLALVYPSINVDNMAEAGIVVSGWQFDDITEEKAAGVFASASNASAQTAAAHADLSGQSASASNQAKLDAQTARSDAQLARNEAITAKDSAEGASSAAATSLSLTVTARDATRLAMQASNPDNFADGSTWVQRTDWGGSGYHNAAEKLFFTINGGAVEGLHSIPAVAGEVYRVSARYRMIDQGGGAGYIGVVCRPSNILIWVQGAIPSAPLAEWKDISYDFFGRDVMDQVAGTTSFSPMLLIGHDRVSNGQVSRLSVTNINATYQAIESATASNASAQTAGAHADLAGQRATAANASKIAAELAQGASELARSESVSAKNDAQGFAGTANTAQSLSVSAQTAAEKAAKRAHPSTFEDGDKYFNPHSHVRVHSSEAMAWIYHNGTFQNSYSEIQSRYAIPYSPDRRYKIRARVKAATAGSQSLLRLWPYKDADSTIDSAENGYFDIYVTNPTDGFGWVEGVFSNHNFVASFVGARIYPGYPSQNGLVEVAALELTDITSEFASGVSANAAAQSASNAAASSTAAGEQASSATASANTATTEAGKASASEGRAAASASLADGYANSASSFASLSATSARNSLIDAARVAGMDFGLGYEVIVGNGGNCFDRARINYKEAVGNHPNIVIVDEYDKGKVLRVGPGVNAFFSSRAYLKVEDGRVYEATNSYRTPQVASGAHQPFTYVGFALFDAAGNYYSNFYTWANTATDTWVNVKTQTTTAQLRAVYPAVAYIAALCGTNYRDEDPGLTSIQHTTGTKIADVTDRVAAEAASSAAISNASFAGTKADEAGQSALASNQSKLDAQAANGTAQSAAGVATSQAAIATAEAASAQTSATLSARFARNGIAPDPVFGTWNGAAYSCPTSWGMSANEGNGYFGGYGQGSNTRNIYSGRSAFQHDRQGVEAYVTRAIPPALNNGWWVFETAVELEDGDSKGSGALLQYGGPGLPYGECRLDFFVDPRADGTGANTNKSITNSPTSRIQNFSKLFQISGLTGATEFNSLHMMAGWSGFGSTGNFLRAIWHMLNVRPATPEEILTRTALPALQAQVNTQAGVIADLDSKLQAYHEVTVIAGTNRARIGIYAESSPGVRASLIELQAEAVWLGPNRALEITASGSRFNGNLNAGAKVTVGNGAGWNIALKSRTFTAGDGEVISFGYDFGYSPSYLPISSNGLAPLASGESYDLSLDPVSSTQATARLKINVPGTPSNQVINNDYASGTGPTRQIDKSGPDAIGGSYRMTGSGIVNQQMIGGEDNGGGQTGPILGGEGHNEVSIIFKLWAYVGGVWQQIAEYSDVSTVYVEYSGSYPTTFSFDQTVTVSSGVTKFGLSAIHSGQSASLDITTVSWTAQGSSSGVRSATPNGQKAQITIQP